MEILRQILLVVHILGFAALVGGLLVQLKGPYAVNALMRDGAGTAFVSGLLLVGVLEGGDADVDHMKIGVKFAVSLVVLVLVMANLRKPSLPKGLFLGIAALALLNIGVAVFWSSAHTF
ncbi:hypothetical protein [Nocardioides massiliensis]|uniref:Integral membrane protein n=1 Tax=Nocardioides massiliensis TaxID=1325935 RepID=A0ABT9NP48_9ACTN|nr:hypothetical protein [Nocardioides massiliensis]MDP9822175.1 hypothetical protein [Nocardioides massiliensis]